MACYKIIIIISCVNFYACQMPNDNQSEEPETKTPFSPVDSNGWTDFSPSSDSRILYISEEGDDSKGKIYSCYDYKDPFNPSEPVNSFATYASAFTHTRNGYPDWILFKRGDTFFDFPGENIRNGRGPDEPFLIGSYGNSGSSPLLKTGTKMAIRISRESPSTPRTSQHIAIQGLRFYAHTRNPDNSDFAGYGDAQHGLLISTYNSGNTISNILIEGCVFSYYRNNIVLQASGDPQSISDIKIRKNTILNAYSVTSHSQGLYAAGINRLFVEENIFDHNGWLIQSSGNDRSNGGATFHNHNLYSDGVQNGIYRGNIFLRASSIGTKLQGNTGIDGLIVDNNLYIDGEIGIESCNNYHDNHYRVHNPIVSNNVFYELGLSNPTLRNVGWGMWIQGWDGGEIFNNLLIGHQGQMFFNLGLRSRNIKIYNNTGIMTTMYGIYHTSEVPLIDIQINNNCFENLNNENRRLIVSEGASIDGISFSGNEYYSPGPLEFLVNELSYDMDQWIGEVEPDAGFSKQDFFDRSRTIESYMNLMGEGSSLESFFEICRLQERYHWDSRFTAVNINNWLREGFGME